MSGLLPAGMNQTESGVPAAHSTVPTAGASSSAATMIAVRIVVRMFIGLELPVPGADQGQARERDTEAAVIRLAGDKHRASGMRMIENNINRSLFSNEMPRHDAANLAPWQRIEAADARSADHDIQALPWQQWRTDEGRHIHFKPVIIRLTGIIDGQKASFTNGPCVAIFGAGPAIALPMRRVAFLAKDDLGSCWRPEPDGG